MTVYTVSYSGQDVALQQELLRISEAVSANGRFQIPAVTREPDEPREGLVRLADGTSWDPLSNGTASIVVYLGGTWTALGSGAGGGGDTITVANLGAGGEIFKERVDDELRFRSIVEGTGITVTQNADDITVSLGAITPIAAPTPTDLIATPIWGAVTLNWTVPGSGVAYTEVFASTTDDVNTASIIGSTAIGYLAHYVVDTTTRYYWIRFVSPTGDVGSFFPAANGRSAAAGTAEGFLLTTLTGVITEDQLTSALETRIDEIDQGANSILNRLADTISDVSTNASDLGLLDTRVGTVEGISSANSSAIQSLESTVGALDAGGGQDWQFDTTLESWTATNASLTGPTSGVVTWTPSAANPQLISPTFDQSGSVFTQIVMRVRRTVAGGTWEGKAYYETSGHGISESYYKTIPDPSLVLNEWTVLTWDMSDLTVGGTDWVDNNITDIRIDLVSDNAGTFEIDWILIAKFSTTAFATAIELLDTRVTDNTNDIATNASNITASASDITALESTVNNGSTGVAANATAIGALDTRVTSVEGVNTSQASDITALESTVNDGVTGVAANASALSTLQTTVTNQGTDITANADDLTSLTATVGGNSSNISTLSSVQATQGTDIVSLKARYSVLLDVNGYVTGYVLNNDGSTGSFDILTDSFRLIDPAGGAGQGGIVPFAYASGVVTMQNVVIGNALISDLTVDKLTTGVLGGDINVGAGKIVFRGGGFMRVEGIGFGSSNQFLEWFGPDFANFSSCTEANAISYLKTNGDAYFGGSLSAGVLFNSATGTVLTSDIDSTIGPFGTNGNVKTVVVSYSLSYNYTLTGNQTTSNNPTATVRLQRQAPVNTTLTSFNVVGTEFRTYDSEENFTSVNGNMNGAQTITDTLSSLSNFTYFADLTARFVTAATPFISFQRLTITSTEE